MRIDARTDVAEWTQAGRIARPRAREALLATGAIATAQAWRRFLDRLLAWLGAVALAAALAFFIAANWQALGRFGKLAMIEAVVVVAVAIVAWQGLDTLRGRVALFAAALAVGTLLAFVGQTYQTGADGYELFAAWALAILPWTLVARQSALWLLWIALLDVAAWLYAGLSLDAFGILLSGPRGALWTVLAIHVVALALYEIAIARGVAWADARYAVRTLAVGAGAASTALLMEALLSGSSGADRLRYAAIGYLALLAGLYYAFRVRRVDLFVLAAAVLSAIVVIVTMLARVGVLEDFGGLLGAGVVIVALAGVGARWLRGLEAR